MKNMKRLLAVAMTGVMAVSMLAGCGSSSEGEESDTIKIGSIHPLTGSYAYEAQSIINAQQLAVDEINAAGGIKSMGGKKLELVVGDSQGSADDPREYDLSINTASVGEDYAAELITKYLQDKILKAE